MGHSDKSLRTALEKAIAFPSVDFDTAPVKTIIAAQGGGSKSIAVAAALKVILPHLLKAGIVPAISGTSGSAANAALAAKGLNEGLGATGAGRYLDAYWSKIKTMGAIYGRSRRHDTPFATDEDKWPNIPRSSITLAESFSLVNPVLRMSLPTAAIRDMLDTVVGDWTAVQQGPTAVYTNSVQRNLFTGIEHYVVSTGADNDADALAGSAGLDELGGHMKLKEWLSPLNWMTGNINQYRDGAYKFNPDISTMLNNHDATDVIVIALHGADGKVKTPREQKLYTDQIHRDLSGLQLDDQRRVNFHVIEITLPGNSTSSMNTDPEYLDLLAELGREQAEAQIGAIMESLGTRSSYQPQAHLVQDMVDKGEFAYT